MTQTRDRVLLAAGLACVGAGAVLLFAPGVPGLGPLEPLTDLDTATQVGLVLGLVVAIVAAFQMRRTAQDSLDRSGLRPTPPEQPRDATVPRPGSTLASTYQRVSDRIGRSGRSGWHVVAYGRRARYAEDARTGRPDPSATQLRPPGMAPGPDVDRRRQPPAQQDGGRPLREDRPDRASDHDTGDRTPPTGGRNRGTTERRPSVPDGRRPAPNGTGGRPAESEEGGQRGDRERRPVSNRTGGRPAGEPGQTGEQRAESRQATANRQPTAEGEQPGTGPWDRVDSDRTGRDAGRANRNRGRSAWERRPTPGQFRRRSREQLLELLDDVAETAQEAYVTATGCDPATAERAVAAGEWTDDRVAAAFLATDREAPEFTVTERAAAWLGPQRTLERRLARTLDAIESHADSYLTYESRATASRGESE